MKELIRKEYHAKNVYYEPRILTENWQYFYESLPWDFDPYDPKMDLSLARYHTFGTENLGEKAESTTHAMLKQYNLRPMYKNKKERMPRLDFYGYSK